MMTNGQAEYNCTELFNLSFQFCSVCHIMETLIVEMMVRKLQTIPVPFLQKVHQ